MYSSPIDMLQKERHEKYQVYRISQDDVESLSGYRTGDHTMINAR